MGKSSITSKLVCNEVSKDINDSKDSKPVSAESKRNVKSIKGDQNKEAKIVPSMKSSNNKSKRNDFKSLEENCKMKNEIPVSEEKLTEVSHNQSKSDSLEESNTSNGMKSEHVTSKESKLSQPIPDDKVKNS